MGQRRYVIASALALLLPAASPFAAERLVFVGHWPESDSISQEELQTMMAGGQELAELKSSLGGTV